MNGITEGDIVSLTSDSRRWRVLAIFTDRALIEIVGEAWVRQRTERLEKLHLVNRPTDPEPDPPIRSPAEMPAEFVPEAIARYAAYCGQRTSSSPRLGRKSPGGS
jgi:hypothetical protein